MNLQLSIDLSNDCLTSNTFDNLFAEHDNIHAHMQAIKISVSSWRNTLHIWKSPILNQMSAFRMMAAKGKGFKSTQMLAPFRVVHNHGDNGWKPLLLVGKAGDRDLIEALPGAGADAEAT